MIYRRPASSALITAANRSHQYVYPKSDHPPRPHRSTSSHARWCCILSSAPRVSVSVAVSSPGLCLSSAPAASTHQAIAIHPVKLHNDPATATDPALASYHKRYKNMVKISLLFQRRKSIVYFAQPIPGLVAVAAADPVLNFPFK